MKVKITSGIYGVPTGTEAHVLADGGTVYVAELPDGKRTELNKEDVEPVIRTEHLLAEIDRLKAENSVLRERAFPMLGRQASHRLKPPDLPGVEVGFFDGDDKSIPFLVVQNFSVFSVYLCEQETGVFGAYVRVKPGEVYHHFEYPPVVYRYLRNDAGACIQLVPRD